MPLGTRLKKFLHAKKMKKRARGTGGSNPSASIEPTPDQSAVVDDHEPNVVDCSSANTIPLKETDKPEVEQPEPDNKSHSSDHSPNNALSAIDATINISLILRDASEASSVLIPLRISCTVLLAILQTAREKLVAHANAEALIKRLEHHYTFIEEERRHLESDSLGEPPDEQLLTALEIYIKALEAGRAELTSPSGNAKKTGPYTDRKTHVDPINVLEEEIEKGFRNLVRQVHNCILSATIKTSNGIAETRLLQLLKDSVNARGDRVKPITPGTRVRIVQRLSAWGESSDTPERIFWLHDEAGTGKSSLAAHMAGHWEKEGVLLGRFFFNRNGGRDFRRLDKFCVSLVREMSDHHPLAKAKFLEILGTHSAADVPPFTEAFQTLISVAEELSKRLVKRLLFVIDALDECHEDDVQLLTASILDALPNCQGVRFLLTSRPTKEITAILDGISSVGGKDVVLLDVRHGDAERDHDTSIYVRHVLKGFSAVDQNTVIQCASGVFLWATLACDTLLRTISPERVLDKFQNNQPDQTMQILYETALEAALPPEWSSRDMKLLHTVLQGVSLTYAPISIISIQSFFPKFQGEEVAGEDFVEFFVKKLGSIMKDGTPYLPIYILHPTFREFIEDQKHGARFYISPPDGHHSIAVASLALLTASLTRDVKSLGNGKLPVPFHMKRKFKLKAMLPLGMDVPVRYSIAFWATHASLALSEDEVLQRLANEFFASKLLVWIEWSSAIRELSECIEGLRQLRWAVQVQPYSEVNALTEKWCSDSLRFLLRHNHILVRCGLQAWMSALVFTPKSSMIHQTFSQKPLRPIPELLTDYVDTADIHQVLWDRGSTLNFTTFSPDGKRLIAFGGGLPRLWNAKTLKAIGSLKGGHKWVFAAAFSSDSSLIVTGAEYPSICLWDGFTGAFKETLPHRHETAIHQIKFALSDSIIVAVDEEQVLCWSVTKTERSIDRVRVMQGPAHTGYIATLACSPNGMLLATFSEDRAVKLWNLETLVMVGEPMIGTNEVLTGSFSTDGRRIVAGYGDGMIIIWDVATQNRIHSVDSGSKSIPVLAVSPCGRLLASGGDSLCLWDMDTGKAVGSHLESQVTSLAFSNSGSQLVSASRKTIVTLSEIRSDGSSFAVESVALRGHTSNIHDVAISPNGRLLASVAFDGTLRVWDTDLLEMSTAKEPSVQAHDEVTCMGISHDGARLISAGSEGMLQIWDFTTGKRIGQPFGSEHGEVFILVFSSSSSLWATVTSAHSCGVVFLWQYHSKDNPPTGYCITCEQGEITCVVFTPDNTHLATGGRDKSIQIWQLAVRCCVARFECTDIPSHIAISNDGRHLGSTLHDKSPPVWNLESRELLGHLEPTNHGVARDSPMDFLAFSPDGATILTQKWCGPIQLFDMQMRCFASFDMPSDGIQWGCRAFFSLDGTYLHYWNYTFNLRHLSREISPSPHHLQPKVNAKPPLSPISPLYMDGGTRVRNIRSTRLEGALLALPTDVDARVWVAYENMIAFGAWDGRVFIIRFLKDFI